MSLESTLHDILSEIEELEDVNIWWRSIPDPEQYPQITLQLISKQSDHHLGGALGVAKARVQIDCWSYDFYETVDMSLAIQAALDGISSDSTDTEIHFIKLLNEMSMSEPPDGENSWLFRRMAEYQVRFRV